MNNTINFEQTKERLLKKRKKNLLQAKQISVHQVIAEEDYKDRFQMIIEQYGFDDAYGWLYDRILCDVGLLNPDECYPTPPCTEEEKKAYEDFDKEQLKNGMPISKEERDEMIANGELPF